MMRAVQHHQQDARTKRTETEGWGCWEMQHTHESLACGRLITQIRRRRHRTASTRSGQDNVIQLISQATSPLPSIQALSTHDTITHYSCKLAVVE